MRTAVRGSRFFTSMSPKLRKKPSQLNGAIQELKQARCRPACVWRQRRQVGILTVDRSARADVEVPPLKVERALKPLGVLRELARDVSRGEEVELRPCGGRFVEHRQPFRLLRGVPEGEALAERHAAQESQDSWVVGLQTPGERKRRPDG